jgi:hypothetical protein
MWIGFARSHSGKFVRIDDASPIPGLTVEQVRNAQYQLGAGPVTVSAPNLGTPGIFSKTISIAGILVGTSISLEVQDLSDVYGSLLALDSVKIIVE